MIIDVKLTGQLLEAAVVGIKSDPVLAEKSRGKHFCRITADEEWDGMAIKLIYRSVNAVGAISREETASDRTAVPVPAEVLRAGRLYITAVGMAAEGNEILTSARMRSGLLISPVDSLDAPGADTLAPSQYEQLFALYGVLNEKIGDVSNLDTTVAAVLCRLILQSKTEVIARSGDGCNYSAAVEGLEISVGTEIILIPQSNNQGAATLALNGGEAYQLCLRPGWNVTGDDLRPQLTLPLEAGMLLRGGEYIFRFDGAAWVLQSYISLIGGVGGGKVFVQPDEPKNAVDGSLWIDTDAEPDGSGVYVTEQEMKAYMDEVLGSIELAEEGAY